MVWLSGTGKLYDNSKIVLDSEKKYAFIFLDQLQAMFNSNEVLNYLSDYRFAIFIRIAVQINTKAFLSVQFARELGKKGNNETKNNAKKKDNNNRRAKKQEHVIRWKK